MLPIGVATWQNLSAQYQTRDDISECLCTAISALARLQIHPSVACKVHRVLQAVVIAVSRAAFQFLLCHCAALLVAWSPSPHWAQCHSLAGLPSPLKTFWTLTGCCFPHCLPHPPLGALLACAASLAQISAAQGSVTVQPIQGHLD